MEEAIDNTIKNILDKKEFSADEALKLTQAVLNLARVKKILDDLKNENN